MHFNFKFSVDRNDPTYVQVTYLGKLLNTVYLKKLIKFTSFSYDFFHGFQNKRSLFSEKKDA